MSNFQKNSKDYGEPDITYQLAGAAEQRPLGPWDACLSKNHDGTTQQIDDAVGNFETENQVFLQKAQAVHQARVQEDDVWQKSQVDPVVKQLEAADKQQDSYMTAFRYINDGYAALPDGEALKPDALGVQRTFKDLTSSSSVATRPFMQA